MEIEIKAVLLRDQLFYRGSDTKRVKAGTIVIVKAPGNAYGQLVIPGEPDFFLPVYSWPQNARPLTALELLALEAEQ